jgi:splicing factor 3B subunit 5
MCRISRVNSLLEATAQPTRTPTPHQTQHSGSDTGVATPVRESTSERSSTLSDTVRMAAMQAGGKETLQSQLEHLQLKYVGTGHPDITKHEWASNLHRDSYASYLGHQPMLQYFAVAQNESCGRVRHQLIQVC